MVEFSPYSFHEFLKQQAPQLLASRFANIAESPEVRTPHGTTIISLTYDGGVVMIGDRRATMGNYIASRDITKVFEVDSHSVMGISGTVGVAQELVRLFALELEHYEKIEGVQLSFSGKANRLSTILRNQLQLALQGLTVVPVFSGFDAEQDKGRVFSYDIAGGRYEESDFQCTGSGGGFARSSLNRLWKPGLSESLAVEVGLLALIDAAHYDSATSGPDWRNNIWPTVVCVDASGFREYDAEEIQVLLDSISNKEGGN